MPRLSARRLVVCAIAALIAPSWSPAQAVVAPTCPAEEVHRFDFLVGDWHGLEYLLESPTDSVLDHHVIAHNHKLPFGCALEERWEFIPLKGQSLESAVIRTYDAPSKSWRYSGVSSLLELYTYESERTDSGVVFTHTIKTATPPRSLRLQWIPTSTGYTEVIRVSDDSGKTWPILRHLNYTRDRN